MVTTQKNQLRNLIDSLTDIVQILDPADVHENGTNGVVEDSEIPDPTFTCPPSYRTKKRADEVYLEAFRKIFEFFWGNHIWGDIYEFGTYRGYTARLIATFMKEFDNPNTLYLFDSFEGLPLIQSDVDQKSWEVAINKVWFQGEMQVEKEICHWIQYHLNHIIPRDQLKIVKGFFSDTLDLNLGTTKASLIHLDCDLYDSARLVLEKLLAKDLFQDGSVIACDDYNSNRGNPFMGERKALEDAFAGQCRYSYSPFFSYGWNSMALLVHDCHAVASISAKGANT